MRLNIDNAHMFCSTSNVILKSVVYRKITKIQRLSCFRCSSNTNLCLFPHLFLSVSGGDSDSAAGWGEDIGAEE